MTNDLRKKIDYSIALLRKAEALALRFDPDDGFYLAFSGGKDSQALLHLAQMANVKFKAYMNFTSVDPGEVVRFVKRQYPDVVRVPPRISIYDMAKKKGILPTAKVRWCCAEYKEIGGVGKVTLVGVRREESIRRSKRNEITSSNFKISETFDQFSKHEEEMVACVRGRDKIIISPILHWTERNVWGFSKGTTSKIAHLIHTLMIENKDLGHDIYIAACLYAHRHITAEERAAINAVISAVVEERKEPKGGEK